MSPIAGVVVIGRNEGERLRRCLASLARSGLPVVYVDSASTDNSRQLARESGVHVVELDDCTQLSAARARNEGLTALLELVTDCELVCFLDGDCELASGWIDHASDFLASRPEVAAVAGRRRERSPDASVWNRLCDLEWDTPTGPASATGGDFVVRVSAFQEVGGFDESFVAGEEPELGLRLRRAGWEIERLDREMTLHDAAITKVHGEIEMTEAMATAITRATAAPASTWPSSSTTRSPSTHCIATVVCREATRGMPDSSTT